MGWLRSGAAHGLSELQASPCPWGQSALGCVCGMLLSAWPPAVLMGNEWDTQQIRDPPAPIGFVLFSGHTARDLILPRGFIVGFAVLTVMKRDVPSQDWKS